MTGVEAGSSCTRQACPDLTVPEVKQVLYSTVVDEGASGKDNDYGWGVVDALAAVNMALSLCVSQEGKINLDHPPDNLQVHAKVFVHNHVPEPGGEGPNLIRMSRSEVP